MSTDNRQSEELDGLPSIFGRPSNNRSRTDRIEWLSGRKPHGCFGLRIQSVMMGCSRRHKRPFGTSSQIVDNRRVLFRWGAGFERIVCGSSTTRDERRPTAAVGGPGSAFLRLVARLEHFFHRRCGVKHKVLTLIEGNSLWSRVEKHGTHVASPCVGFCICHQRVTCTASPSFGSYDKIIDVQMCSARQRVDRPHPHDAEKLAVLERSHELETRMRLPLHSLQELRFVQ